MDRGLLVQAIDTLHLSTWGVAFALFAYISWQLRYQNCNPRPLLWLCLLGLVVFYTFSFYKHCILTYLENRVAGRPLCTPWANPIDRFLVWWNANTMPLNADTDTLERCRRAQKAWIDMSANASLIVIVLVVAYLYRCPG